MSNLKSELLAMKNGALGLAAEYIEQLEREASLHECCRRGDELTIKWQIGRIAQLESSLKKANDNHEHFEREWYLRGDKIEKLESERIEIVKTALAAAAKTIELYDDATMREADYMLSSDECADIIRVIDPQLILDWRSTGL